MLARLQRFVERIARAIQNGWRALDDAMPCADDDADIAIMTRGLTNYQSINHRGWSNHLDDTR